MIVELVHAHFDVVLVVVAREAVPSPSYERKITGFLRKRSAL